MPEKSAQLFHRTTLLAAALGASLAVNAPGATRGPATNRGNSPATTRTATMARPATAPATTSATTTRAATVMQAETILKFFPANAGSLASRNDARNFTVEGRVRDVRTETLSNGTTDLKVALVARAQPDDVGEHFTCHIDKASETDAAGLKPDQIVRLTGAIGTISVAAERIELKACHDVSVTGTVNAGEQLPGLWRYASVQIDGAALRKDNQAKGIRNAVVGGVGGEGIPDATFVSAYHLDLTFKPDNTLVAELRNKDQILKRNTGRWTILKDSTDEAQLKLDIVGMASTQVTATLEGKNLKLNLPGFADKFLVPEMSFGKPDSTVQSIDWKGLQDQTRRWVETNTAPAQTQVALKYFSDLLGQTENGQKGFAMAVGAGMLKRGRAAYVVGLYGKLTVLDYSDAENQLNAATKNSNNWTLMPQWGGLVQPEVKVENFAIDNRNALDLAKPVTGKVVLRGLRRMPEGQYIMVLAMAGGASMVGLNGTPGPDPETFNFSFPPLPAGPLNPRLAVFIVGRQGRGADQPGDQSQRVIADPVPVLLDLAR